MSSKGKEEEAGMPRPAGGRDRSLQGGEASGAGLDALRAGDKVGEYILEEPIGQGGCGTVWRARHAVLPGVVVAVKLPRDPELIGLLRRESLLQHGLDHPGVLKVLGVDLDAEVPYVVQEYAAGGDLARLIRKHGRIPPDRALDIFRQIVEILSYAHARGVVHSDLKPGNILLDEKGRVLIGDFGLGRGVETLTASVLRESIESLGPHTDGRYLGGTWEYMAPELKEAGEEKTLDPRVDVFALGIMLYEMLMGERPAGRVSLVHISRDLDALFARCWTSRKDRYADAGELLKDIRRLEKRKPLAGGQVADRRQPVRAAGPSSARSDYSRAASLRWIFWAYLVPLMIFAVAMSFVWFNEDGRQNDDKGEARVEGPPVEPKLAAWESKDEADELWRIRKQIEETAHTVEQAVSLLRGFRARANERQLLEYARIWEESLLAGDEPRDIEVRWRRFKLDKASYRKRFYAGLEPGRPDVYLRVYRERDGREELIFDSSSKALEGWAFDWTGKTAYPTFHVNWRKGDGLRVELRENDIFRDDTIAEYRLGGEISILLLSTQRIDKAGHAIEFSSDFGFGK